MLCKFKALKDIMNKKLEQTIFLITRKEGWKWSNIKLDME